MIDKLKLTSVISKYYLNGLHNQVKWRIKDNKLIVYAGEAGRVCKVELNDVPLEDAELGIFDTNKLSKLLSITHGELSITLDKIKAVYTKMHIADTNFDLTYSLADVMILGKNTWYEDPDEWGIDISITKDDLNHLIKAKNALGDVDSMLINTVLDLDGNPVCEFIFGDNTGFSNKITYQIYGGVITDNHISLPFNSNIFRDILVANKDQETFTLKLSTQGILKMIFSSDDINSEYFVSRNE